MSRPRILIAGLRGGGGKTLVSVAIAAAWRRQGRRVAVFKKGPDYIDAAWLSMAAQRTCRNLDLFLMQPRTIVGSFLASAESADVALIEGNRGLYDGMDAQGTCSTAEVAKLLRCPVVLVAECVKSTRTVAASILGCQRLDPEVGLQGVILNQTAGPRHDAVLREAVTEICGLPVLGAIPRLGRQLFPERHLGLIPPQEHHEIAGAIQQAAEIAEQYLDLPALAAIACRASELEPAGRRAPRSPREEIRRAERDEHGEPSARIGVFRDTAFQFYYPENLEALVREGARLVEISPVRETQLPEVDALYIGGGFPEMAAPALAENQPFHESLRRAVRAGIPVYAECGGAVFLGQELAFDEKRYPMAAVLPIHFNFAPKPKGHGYTVLETVRANPFFSVGESLRGHEFHHTHVQPAAAKDLTFAFKVLRGYGFDGQRDGLCCRNVLACYTHLHALGAESWAPSLVRAAVEFQASRLES